MADRQIVLSGMRYVHMLLINRTGQRVIHDLRMAVFRHVTSRSLRFFDRSPVGRLVSPPFQRRHRPRYRSAMADPRRYPIPARVHRVEDLVRRSRFVTVVAHAPTPAAARARRTRIS